MPTNAIPSYWICGKPVLLEDCKIDQQGRPVHENCYLHRVENPSLSRV
jgi:hypothetical protein